MHGDRADTRESTQSEAFKEIAIRLARGRGIVCDFGDDEWQAFLINSSETRVVFEIFCDRQGFHEELIVSRGDFERTARQVRDQERR